VLMSNSDSFGGLHHFNIQLPIDVIRRLPTRLFSTTKSSLPACESQLPRLPVPLKDEQTTLSLALHISWACAILSSDQSRVQQHVASSSDTKNRGNKPTQSLAQQPKSKLLQCNDSWPHTRRSCRSRQAQSIFDLPGAPTRSRGLPPISLCNVQR